jgi:hypothetical protein
MTAQTYEWDQLGGEIMDSRSLIAVAEEIEETPREDWEDDWAETLAAVKAIEDYAPADWQYGETFIREDHFEDYARELAEDIGAIDKDASWPNTYIDWKAAADALKQDYTTYEFMGHTYYARS